ncbi:MAG: mandelate racemase/muconate lactonizing enzyme family protein [Candidatus Latescibacteria bacterium]|jgi:glucarate dehydratase|nr:mandelate racemase/muconate lactonizing enzyme family protein [Candidatus Latescibacterota bacterium]
MYDVDAIEAYDHQVVADIKEKQAYINESGRATGHVITSVRCHRVLMPWTGTKRWDGSAEGFSFAEFETNHGLVGIAEGVSSDESELSDRVIGKNVFDHSIRGDLGMAYWDFAGKIAGQPLYRYLRDIFEVDTPEATHVPMAAYTWYRFPDINDEHEVTFETYPAHLKQLIHDHGFHHLKLSMCDFEPMRYVELIHNIRDVIGFDVNIRVDPHASWSESEALRFMKGVEDCHLEWIEEPVGGYFENIYRAGHRLRQMSTVPISSHVWLPPLRRDKQPLRYGKYPSGRYGDETVDQPLDLHALRRFVAADISAPDAYAGPLALKRYYDTARFMGMDIGMHSAYELGPGTAIRLHTAAFTFPYNISYHIVWGNGTAPSALHALDAHYNQWEGDVIRGGKMAYEKGCLALPEGPGIGVELDSDLLEHYKWTDEKQATHTAHIEAIRARHLDTLGWRRDRMGWTRI